MPSMTRAAAFAVLIGLAVALAACGKRGDPEYPAGTPMEKVEKPDGTTTDRAKKPSRPFVLDGLLN